MTPQFVEDQTFEKTGSVRYRVLGDEAVIVEQERGEMVIVNRAGAMVMDLATNGETVEAIAAALVETFGIDGQRAAEDTQAFLATLTEEGILRPRSP